MPRKRQRSPVATPIVAAAVTLPGWAARGTSQAEQHEGAGSADRAIQHDDDRLTDREAGEAARGDLVDGEPRH